MIAYLTKWRADRAAKKQAAAKRAEAERTELQAKVGEVAAVAQEHYEKAWGAKFTPWRQPVRAANPVAVAYFHIPGSGVIYVLRAEPDGTTLTRL